MKFTTIFSLVLFSAISTQSLAQNQSADCSTLHQQNQYQSAIIQCDNEFVSGNSRAGYLLGKMHYNGQGVQQDVERALDYYQLSAVNNNIDAQIALGVHYGANEEYKQSYAYFRLAANNGSDIATAGLEVIQPWLTAQDLSRAENFLQLVENAINSNASYYQRLAMR